MNTNTRLPLVTEQTLRVLCADYDRRRQALQRGCMPPEIADTAMLLNQVIDGAIEQEYSKMRAYHERFADIMRQDIAECRGYMLSPLSGIMCEGSYKKYKRSIKESIAKKLGLPIQ